jgi:hypothetical protein
MEETREHPGCEAPVFRSGEQMDRDRAHRLVPEWPMPSADERQRLVKMSRGLPSATEIAAEKPPEAPWAYHAARILCAWPSRVQAARAARARHKPKKGNEVPRKINTQPNAGSLPNGVSALRKQRL